MRIFALRKTSSENVLLRRYPYRNARRACRRQQIERRTADDFARHLPAGRRRRADAHADGLFSRRIQVRGVLQPLPRDRPRVQRGLELRLPDFRRPGDVLRTLGKPGETPLRERTAPADQERRILRGLLLRLPLRGRADRRAGAFQVGDARHVPRCRPRGRRGPHRGPRRHRHQAAGQGGCHLQRGARGGLRGPHRR